MSNDVCNILINHKETIAVILNGCIRYSLEYYDKVIQNIIRLFENDYIVDIYFHTWDTFEKTNVDKHEYAYDKDKLLELLYSIKNIKNVIIDKPFSEKYYDDNKFPYNQFNVHTNYSYKPTRTAIYNCSFAYNSLIDNIKNSGKKYDYILRCRNDLIFDIDNISNLKHYMLNNYICIPPNIWCPVKPEYINDHLAIAKSDILIKGLFSNIDEIKNIVNSSWNQEEVTYNLLSRTKSPFHIFKLKGLYYISSRTFNN
jgi:hypothetical protein